MLLAFRPLNSESDPSSPDVCHPISIAQCDFLRTSYPCNNRTAPAAAISVASCTFILCRRLHYSSTSTV